MSHSKLSKTLAVYLAAFYGIWTLFELLGKDWLAPVISHPAVLAFVTSGVVKNLVWTLPAVMLILHFDLPVPLGEMMKFKGNWRAFGAIAAGFAAYILLGDVFQNGQIALSETFGAEEWIIVFFVGITEEIVFRGWLLNAALARGRRWPQILLNALLFLLIHFPIWIHSGVFLSNFTNLGFVCILALSVIFSWSFLKSRSLWPPILLHTFWDLMMFLFLE